MERSDCYYMAKALELAEKGIGAVNPNPLVGAVIVLNGEIIGEGFHEKYGQPHAERNALKNCKVPTKGATLYVNLEPCCHHGKTPPCTDAILDSGIQRVVISSVDPNPLVSGKGIEILKEHGIQVDLGVMERENEELNQVFFHYIRTRRPFVIMKYAMTMDGKIATVRGKSKWITGEEARENVHETRNLCSGIMVGVNTVIMDDPMLDCRLPGGSNGIRIICDTHLRIPETSKVVGTAAEIPTYIATCCESGKKMERLAEKGCRILILPQKNAHVDLNLLMERLGEEKLDSILLEGGSALNFSALEEGIVDKVQVYMAPRIFGGAGGMTPVGGRGVDAPEDGFKLIRKGIRSFGEDILMEFEVIKNVHGNS